MWHSPHHATICWDHYTIEILGVECVVRSHALRHVGRVVYAPEHEGVVEVEQLSLGMARILVKRVVDLKHAPLLAVLFVRPNLTRHEARLDKLKRAGQVIVHRIADEVQQVEVVPFRLTLHVLVRLSRLVPRLDYLAISTLDPDALRGVDPTIVSVAFAKALNDSFGVLDINRACGLIVARETFNGQQRAAEIPRHIDGGDFTPPIQATMGRNDRL